MLKGSRGSRDRSCTRVFWPGKPGDHAQSAGDGFRSRDPGVINDRCLLPRLKGFFFRSTQDAGIDAAHEYPQQRPEYQKHCLKPHLPFYGPPREAS